MKTETQAVANAFKIVSAKSGYPASFLRHVSNKRFLSIREEECPMVPMSCRDHDAYAANSQFITHLMGRILGQQGLSPTPIDTRGFESILNLVDTTTADSFDLFYGLYKFNQNVMETIVKLRSAVDNVVGHLEEMDNQ
jgi:prephenate dehydrogenase